MPEIIFRQVPIEIKTKFYHPHQCFVCKEWGVFGILTYSEHIETSKFICKNCQPIPLIPAPLPKQTEFKRTHECFSCEKKTRIGILTYCSRCEEAEFVCPKCLISWFDQIYPEEYGYQFKPKIWE